ncbi:MAG: DNA-formamidopyrimidine glycosylase, partial [Verrucomicrobia bacterium]|nr:DNA-formamidopyrimidine glycosylase [Verrucomicrobiota bacterium]
MPELPEVEVLVRHLAPLLRGKTIRAVEVRRARVLGATSERKLRAALAGATFRGVTRRAKYLVFEFKPRRGAPPLRLLGHLGMTGRMFLQPHAAPLPKHAAVVLGLGRTRFVFEDTRYFGRFTLDTGALDRIGPEPADFQTVPGEFAAALGRSSQAIKVKLLDQSLVAGVGNIYASEACFVARLSPKRRADGLKPAEVARLWAAIRAVLAEAVRLGSTVPLSFGRGGKSDGLFYYGRAAGAPDYYEERLRVYDRAGKPCLRCGAPVKRIVQA